MANLVPAEIIENRIFLIRKQKVMLDVHLAQLYGVSTKNLNKAVRRNRKRFPKDFMFQLAAGEAKNLRFQIGTSSSGHGGRRYLPCVFTEQGIAMLSSVLKSDRAIRINILIMRTFVKIRDLMATHIDLARKIEEHDKNIRAIIAIIKELLQPPLMPLKKERPMGFRA